jgi:SAM-dependent methyltransferase
LHHWFDKVARGNAYPVWRCKSCKGAFVLPRPTRECLEDYYGDSYRPTAGESPEDGWRKALEEEISYPNSTLDALRMIGWCKKLASGNRLLDVGAGFGFFSREAVANGFTVKALEPAPYYMEIFSRMNGFQAEPRMLDSKFALAHKAAFDVVIMSQVMEHLPDLEETFRSITSLLVPGGIVAVAVPHFRSLVSRLQGRGDMFIAPPEHLNFFTLESLVRLFGRNGFQAIHAETVSRFDPRRIKARLGFAGTLAVPVLAGALRLSDKASRGMYINAYFRRSEASGSAP